MNNKRKIFLTGATGLVGSYLLKLFLQNGHKTYCLARAETGNRARERVLNVLKFWDEDILTKCKDNLIVLDGDISKEYIGLNKKDSDLLRNEMEEVFHCAALTVFNLPIEKINKINVAGTKNVLDFALACKNIKKINHVSTAYVCGDYNGVFKEDDLDLGQRFSNSYHESKFEAEKLIKKYRNNGLWIDVFRPPFIVGESVTGKITTFQHAIYQLIHVWQGELFKIFPGKNCFMNFIFVNDLCESMIKIAFNEEARSCNYHTFSNKTVSLELILNIASNALGFLKPKMVMRDELYKYDLTPLQNKILQNNILLYNNNVKFETFKTNLILKKYDFKFSKINENNFMKLLEYAIKAGFIRNTSKSAH